MIKNINIILEALNIDEDIILQRSFELEEYAWDSLAMVLIQSYFADELELEVDPSELASLSTVGELDDFISEKIDKV